MAPDTSVDLTLYIAGRASDFFGRGWAFSKIDAWLANPGRRSIFLLSGAPGSGKSAVMARLAQVSLGEAGIPGCARLNPGFLAHFHFCQARKDETLNPLWYVEALSCSLANRYPPFREALLAQQGQDVNITVQQTTGDVAPGGQVTGVLIQALHIGGLSPRAAFDRTVRRPLEALCIPGFAGPVVILVDALDQAQTWDEEENIATLLANAFAPGNLPPQVQALLASNNDEQVEKWFGQPALDLIDDAPRGARDVEGYVYRQLAGRPEEQRKQIARRLERAARGNFLYARSALKDLLAAADGQRLPALPRLPRDLDGIYRSFIEDHLARSQKLWKQVRPLLGALVVARDNGLTRDQLHGIMDLFKELSPSETDDLLAACSQYLEGRGLTGPFRVYHESFSTFLRERTDYSVYPAEANQAIADFFLQVYGHDWLACEDEYALRYTLVHLLDAAAAATRPEDRLVLARIQAKSAALEQDDSYKVARMRQLSRGELAPAVEAFISHKALGFVGRCWVFRRLNEWLDSGEPRHFLIVGGSGTGKTALAARLWQISRGLVPVDELQFPHLAPGYLTYAHLSQAVDPTSLEPLVFLEGLSRMLVVRYKDYARLYLDRVLKRLALSQGQAAGDPGPALPAKVDRPAQSLQGKAKLWGRLVGQVLAGERDWRQELRHGLDALDVDQDTALRQIVSRVRTVRDAADALIEPLREMVADNPNLRVVILLDGLDRFAGSARLMELKLQSLLGRLPEQVRFAFLSRPLPAIFEALGPAQVDLDAELPGGENDILTYALGRLSSLPEPERRKAAELVATLSGGSFVVAELPWTKEQSMLELKPRLPSTVAGRIDGFTGRTWLLPKILKWYDAASERVFLLTGRPGTGKGIIVAWLAGGGPAPKDPGAAGHIIEVCWEWRWM